MAAPAEYAHVRIAARSTSADAAQASIRPVSRQPPASNMMAVLPRVNPHVGCADGHAPPESMSTSVADGASAAAMAAWPPWAATYHSVSPPSGDVSAGMKYAASGPARGPLSSPAPARESSLGR